jgi:two-component system chemotaxis response regulator CheY
MMGSILVVEDDADIRTALSSILGEEGYAVSCASDGCEALELLRAGLRPDAILLDLMMPVMSGPEFRAKQLEDPLLAAIPIVILTADGRITEVARALGAAAAFAKPFELGDLLETVARLRTPGGTAALPA